MNIEIAERLAKLRKEKGLSQEALAKEIGVSRQAISKWERAEASPDTDNLIALAKLYNMTLDDLLKTSHSTDNQKQDKPKKDEVHISLTKGIHVKDKEGSEVHVGWNGIHVDDKKENTKVDVDSNGVFIDGKQYDHDDFITHNKKSFPIASILILVYLFIGIFFNLWHPGWIILLFIPIIESIISAIKKKNPSKIAYPVICAAVFLFFGFYYNMWHPAWAIFLTIPVFYSLVSYFRQK